MNVTRSKHMCLIGMIALVLSSCSVSRHLPQDTYLLDKVKVVSEEEPKVVEQFFDNDCMIRLSMRLSRLPRLVERYEKLVIASKNDLRIERL